MKNVLLVNPPTHFAQGEARALDNSAPHLGLLYLIAYVHQHSSEFRCHYMDIAPEGLSLARVLDRVRQMEPFAIGISVSTPQLQGAWELARALRTLPGRRIPLFAGGAHIRSDPSFPERHPGLFDHTICGDGEVVFLASLNMLARGEVPPTVQQGVRVADLDSLPFPERSQVKRRAYTGDETVILTRGCPFDCYFCSSPVVDREVRVRSADNVMRELRACGITGAGRSNRPFLFSDDTFNVHRRRTLELCDALREEGAGVRGRWLFGAGASKPRLRWRTSARVDLMDEALVAAMASAGCEWVFLGVEAGNERIRSEIVRKGRFSNTHLRQVVQLCHAYGVKAGAYFILGHPGETRLELQETEDLIFQTGFDGVSVALLLPFPGTRVWDLAVDKGVVSFDLLDRFMHKELGEGYGEAYPLFFPQELERAHLFQVLRRINRRFYLKPRILLERLSTDLRHPARLLLDARQLAHIATRGASITRPFTTDRTKKR